MDVNLDSVESVSYHVSFKEFVCNLAEWIKSVWKDELNYSFIDESTFEFQMMFLANKGFHFFLIS